MRMSELREACESAGMEEESGISYRSAFRKMTFNGPLKAAGSNASGWSEKALDEPIHAQHEAWLLVA